MRLQLAATVVVSPSLACALCLAARCRGAGDHRTADKTLSPYFFVEGGDPSIDRLPLKDTRVDVAIAGVIADVTVRQVYENRGTRPIHARYVFPASTRAAVYGMTMTVGNVRTVAKIRERERATREFEAAKSEGKSASLLEQSRPNVFTMKVANVMPGDTIVGRAQIHGAARADRRRVRVRVPDGRRTAVLRKARKPGVRPQTRSSRLRTRTRAKRRAASSISPACSRPACRSRSSTRRRIRWLTARAGAGARR